MTNVILPTLLITKITNLLLYQAPLKALELSDSSHINGQRYQNALRT